MKKCILPVALLLGLGAYAQQAGDNQNTRTIKPETQGKPEGLVVPEEKRVTHVETTGTSQNYPRYYVLTRDGQTVELTLQERIAKMEGEIQSLEGKIFTLQDDPIGNAAEIQEKTAILEQKKTELETIKQNH